MAQFVVLGQKGGEIAGIGQDQDGEENAAIEKGQQGPSDWGGDRGLLFHQGMASKEVSLDLQIHGSKFRPRCQNTCRLRPVGWLRFNAGAQIRKIRTLAVLVSPAGRYNPPVDNRER